MDLNKVEVFKIAQNIEQDGMEFYKLAAQFSQDEIDASIFLDLVEMEAEHYNIFLDLEKKHKDSSYVDSSEIKAYLKSQLNAGIFQNRSAIDNWNTINNTLDIFHLAHQNEIETVEFYTALKENIADQETKSILEKVIQEEKAHVNMMNNYIKELS